MRSGMGRRASLGAAQRLVISCGLALDTTVGLGKMTSSLLLLAFFLPEQLPRPGTLPMPGVWSVVPGHIVAHQATQHGCIARAHLDDRLHLARLDLRAAADFRH